MNKEERINYENMLKEVIKENLSKSSDSELNLSVIYSLIDRLGTERSYIIIDEVVSNFLNIYEKDKAKDIVNKFKDQYEKRNLKKNFWKNCKSSNLLKMKHFFFEVEAYIYSDIETRKVLLKNLQESSKNISETEKRQILELVYITTENYYTKDIDFCKFNKKFLILTNFK